VPSTRFHHPQTESSFVVNQNFLLISTFWHLLKTRSRFLVFRGSWVPLHPYFKLETKFFKKLSSFFMTFAPNYLASKRWEKVGHQELCSTPRKQEIHPWLILENLILPDFQNTCHILTTMLSPWNIYQPTNFVGYDNSNKHVFHLSKLSLRLLGDWNKHVKICLHFNSKFLV
jgi:hypothetical protein